MIADRIRDIEDEMARTQKNKRTSNHLGLLKAKLAKLKRELLQQPRGGGGGGGIGFAVQKSGDARVGLVGFPSVGKSTLLNMMTPTISEVADYEFTTLTCVPGTYEYMGARIQLLDLPGIIEGAKDGKGRGRQVIAVARTCSLILLMLDGTKPLTLKHKIERELEGFGMRLNKLPPDISVKQKDRGGLTMTSTCTLTNIDYDTVKVIFDEYRMANVDVCFRCDATIDELIDVVEGNRAYMPCIYVINKIDHVSMEEIELFSKMEHSVLISADKGWNLDELRERIWDDLDLLRVFTKPRGEKPDLADPVVVPARGVSVEVLCNRLHRQILKDFKHAWVWGSSVRHNPQKVGKDHVLDDEDVIQIVKKI